MFRGTQPNQTTYGKGYYLKGEKLELFFLFFYDKCSVFYDKCSVFFPICFFFSFLTHRIEKKKAQAKKRRAL